MRRVVAAELFQSWDDRWVKHLVVESRYPKQGRVMSNKKSRVCHAVLE